MSNEDKQTVLDTRKKNKGKSPKGRRTSEVGSKLKDVKSQLAELKKRTIASLSKVKTPSEDGSESDTPDNARDSFGGRQSMKQKKE